MIPHSRTFISYDEIEAVTNSLRNGNLTKGKQNALFRDEFQEFIGSNFVHLTSSGTMAFYIILRALELKDGDEVLMPDYICNSLIGPIQNVGAIPILYDNGVDNWLASLDSIISKISSKTKVILINHTYGQVFKNIKQLRTVIPVNIHIIEDCCHMISSNYSPFSKYVGKYSLCSFYSFNATKLIASGEGGAISSNDKLFIDKIKSFEIGDYLSDLSCCLARVQLRELNQFLEKRSLIATKYFKEFKRYLPVDFNIDSSIHFRFPLLIKENRFFWESKTIAFRKGVDSLISQRINIKPEPNALSVLTRTVSLPIYPSLVTDEIDQIIDETHKLILNGSEITHK